MLEKLIGQKTVCPWWLCFTFDNPLRKLFHNPEAILIPYVRSGDSVIDLGSGMGYFSIALANLVGPAGHVTAIDIQMPMLSALMKRAKRNAVSERITTYLASPDTLGHHSAADFILAFWMLHEVSDQRRFLTEIHQSLKPNGLFLLVEPIMHVTKGDFLRALATAQDIGFSLKESPKIRISRSVVLVRNNEMRDVPQQG
ncbi:class I SAM-dependent methyltransferase [Thermodesulfobacteriota bacterium]